MVDVWCRFQNDDVGDFYHEAASASRRILLFTRWVNAGLTSEAIKKLARNIEYDEE
ncbi:hypothetical protein QNH46_04255 [Paenibacillus woosongensis]|uniref:Uncharacterized protein n=1 Tax=Paenibacillus woosongensis TaxID=307580 RepID=A0AA95I9K1_9BACL|nr:hypothetical protein [Paenibacillus woosongensis]WHX49894.1 hypothetical protein QNH46_04255 [Paenibacillus woosongensis]